jgi:Protein of unknown function (DUF4012)
MASERRAWWANELARIAAIGSIAGIGVAVAGLRPTGAAGVDTPMTLVGAAIFVTTISTTSWTARWRAGLHGVILAVVAGIALQVLARLGNVWRFGISTAIVLFPLAVIFLFAVERRTGRRRVLWLMALGGLVLLGIVGVIGLGAATVAARPELTRGTEVAKQALQSLKSGDFTGARAGFRLAANLFAKADKDFSKPWTQPARLIPVIAQHRRAAVSLTASAGTVSNTIANVLGEIDFDRLRVVNGTIDVKAIEALADPLDRLTAALTELKSSVVAADSQWVIGPIRSRLSKLTKQIDQQQIEGERASIAVQRAPALLGANGKRTYFIAFTTPAEARGLGGFMGNWAEVTIDGGQIAVTNFGRTADLAVDGDTEHWVRITSSPHFPDVAQLIADGYPAFSGHKVDGVFAMDVFTIAALIKLTGPIDVPSIGKTVTADNAAKFLLSDQYALVADRADRIDLLEEVARTTISRLLTTPLPAPPELLKLLGPFATQGRLLGWSPQADEENLFERTNMSGELPALNGGDGLAVVVNNIGNNKIDYYLTGDVAYAVTTDRKSGKVTATLDITLRNNAPAGVAVPPIVFENSEGQPPGTNVMKLSVYSALPVTGVKIDGQLISTPTGDTQRGYNLSTIPVSIAAQATVKITVQLAGPIDLADGYHVVTRAAALFDPFKTSIAVDGKTTTPAGH